MTCWKPQQCGYEDWLRASCKRGQMWISQACYGRRLFVIEMFETFVDLHSLRVGCRPTAEAATRPFRQHMEHRAHYRSLFSLWAEFTARHSDVLHFKGAICKAPGLIPKWLTLLFKSVGPGHQPKRRDSLTLLHRTFNFCSLFFLLNQLSKNSPTNPHPAQSDTKFQFPEGRVRDSHLKAGIFFPHFALCRRLRLLILTVTYLQMHVYLCWSVSSTCLSYL